MGDRRLLDHDPDTGETVWFHPSHDGDSYGLEYEHDCTGIIEHNKALQNTGGAAWKHGDDYRLEASIPNGILMKWLNEDGIQFWTEEGKQRIVKRLNDPDWRWLKTFDGRI